MNSYARFVAPLTLSVTALFLAGCNGNSSSSQSSGVYDTTTAGVVGSSIANSASQSDDSSGTIIGAMQKTPSLAALVVPTASAATCASSAKIVGGTCSGAVLNLALAGCTTAGGAATWTGTDVLTFGSSGTCTSAVATGGSGGLNGMAASASVNLTSPSSGITRTLASGAYVTTTSDASSTSGYNTPVGGGMTLTVGSTSFTAGRTLNVLGVHRVEYAAGATSPTYDHTLNTTTPLSITGVGSSRQIIAGTIQLQHNLAKYTASAQITTPLTFTTGCCFPTAGVVSTTFTTGTKTGSETMTFNSSCGSVSLANSSGTSTSLQLAHCM